MAPPSTPGSGAPLTPEAQRALLSRAAGSLASAPDFDAALRQAIAVCLPGLGDFGFFDAVLADGSVRRTVAAHQAPDIEALLAPTGWVKQEHPELNLCGLSTGQPGLHPDTDDGWYRRIAANEGHLALLRQLAFRSMITVPMRYRGELLGALTLFMGRSGRRHGPADLDFAAELANLAAPLVVNARLLEQHREAEAALRTSEERLRMALEAGQVGIWDWNVATGQVSWSDRVYQMHGMAVGSDTGGYQGFRARVHPDDLPRVEAALKEALAGGAPYSVEFRSPHPDGRVRWIATRSHVVRDSAGQPLRMVGTSTDVTERVELLAAERRARGEAESARRRLELLASAGAVLARSLDPQETLRAIASTVVPAIADWCRIDLMDEDGQLQRGVAFHSDPARAEQALQMARQLRAAPTTEGSMAWVLQHQKPYFGRFDAPHAHADPQLRLYTGTFGMNTYYIVPLLARGRVVGAMAVIQAESGRDLSSDDRALVDELARRAALALDNARLFTEAESARRQAESANRAKDEFLAVLGHELRNPLAPIATTLELMARRSPATAVEERRVIGRQVAHLSRLIDDLLDISRITQGKVQLKREPVDLRAVIANALELTRPVFEQHERPVQVRLDPGPAQVEGDPVRLAQVLTNLLVNAAKFTPASGRVSLELRTSGGEAEIVVADTGCGIAPSLLPQVFNQFVQGRQTLDRKGGGLGLGLAIVRSLVEMHGGSVGAHSAGEGQGSTFTVRLPLCDASQDATVPGRRAAPPASAGGRVLVVDDNTDAAETLAALLDVTGFQTRTAADARAALQVLDEFQPELALLDIGLPEIDGYQLAGLIRQRPAGGGIKLVALTGYGSENDRARALQARFDDHLVKPVAFEQLVQAIERLRQRG